MTNEATKYILKDGSVIDTREGWIASYSVEELELRRLTAEEAFEADVGNTLIEIETDNTRIIFDNAGGITLQLNSWGHYYRDEKQCAEDLAKWLEYGDTSDWEGHEDEALACNPSDDLIRNGSYRVYVLSDADTIESVIIEMLRSKCHWYRDLVKAMAKHL